MISENFIPSRHGVQREQAKSMLGLVSKIMPEVEPDEQRWQAMGQALMHGDAAMDSLLEWMYATDLSAGRKLFEQALEHGIASVEDAPEPLQHFFAVIDNPPAWLNRRQLELGSKIHHRSGVDGVYLARDVAFVGGYQASAFNKTLLLTGALKKGPSRRFAETLQWGLDCTADGGLQRFGVGFKSTIRVRLIHAIVRRHVQQLPQWKMREWGLPINQTDMSATLLGALFVPVLCSQILGMPLLEQEREAVTHHARYVGWLMGVEEGWLPQSHRQAMVMLYQLLLSISNADETSVQLAQPMMTAPLRQRSGFTARWRERYERELHLSLSRAFLGRKGMRNLGLPTNVLPWYPALALPRNLAVQALSRIMPGGLERQAQRGRAAQEMLLADICGAQPAQVGGAAPQYATHH